MFTIQTKTYGDSGRKKIPDSKTRKSPKGPNKLQPHENAMRSLVSESGYLQ